MKKSIGRRDFLKSVIGGIPLLTLDWDSLPRSREKTGRSSGDT